jgi:RNA polymerase-binding transcription factor DksA
MTHPPDHRRDRRPARAVVDATAIGRLLEGEERRLRSLLGSLELGLSGVGGVVDGQGPAGRHLADLASETLEREVDSTLLEDVSAELRELQRARERLALGRYGLCERCHQPIPPERLAVVPAARFCVRDEERYELGGVHLADLDGGPADGGVAALGRTSDTAATVFALDEVLSDDDEYTADDEYGADEATSAAPEEAAMRVRDGDELEAEEHEPADWEDGEPDERDDALDGDGEDGDTDVGDTGGGPPRGAEPDGAPNAGLAYEVEPDVASLVERQLGRA